MQEYDAIVIGGGTGNKVASYASGKGLKTALIEPGPIGGTCLNRGCNPSKMLIAHANVVNTIKDADRFRISADLTDIEFPTLVNDVNSTLGEIASRMGQSKRDDPNLDLIKEYTEFVDDRTIAVNGTEMYGDKIVVAAGSRPAIPPVDGINDVDYITSREAITLEEVPGELVVLGGGYIAAELGYFFDAMGAEVTLVEMLDTLVPREDSEIAEAFTEAARERHTIHVGHRVTAVEERDGRVHVQAESSDGSTIDVDGDTLLVATGRRPNTDSLKVHKAGIETDANDRIVTNEYLEASSANVWAQGDIADNWAYKHSADYETELVKRNAFDEGRQPVDFTAMPHAIFTEPQIGGVGYTEDQLDAADRDYVVGKSTFPGSSMGRALKLEHGLAKVLADPDTGTILGCHLFGHEASTLLHELVLATKHDLTVHDVAETIHVHPALSKIVRSACKDAVQHLE